MLFVASIVEGHGEVEALPALLHRMVAHLGISEILRVNPPIRVKSGSFLNDDEYFRKHVELAAAKAIQAGGVVLILLDCEDQCPGQLGPELMKKAQAVRSDVRILVVLAYREFETWFLGAASSLSGHCGLPANLEPPSEVEQIRDAKGWLGKHTGNGYDEITHQLKLTRIFDLSQACSVPSFQRFCKRLPQLLGTDRERSDNC